MGQPNALRGWLAIALFVVLTPVVFLGIYPGWKTALVLVVVGLVGIAGLAIGIRVRGTSALTVIGLAVDRLMQEASGRGRERRSDRIARPTGYWKAQLIEATGGQCEIQTCRNIAHLEVHHINEHARGGGNELRNLLVLCPNHHKQAGSGAINKQRQRTLATKPKRFGDAAFPSRWERSVLKRAKDSEEDDFGFTLG